MKYIADMLTALRLIMAIPIVISAALGLWQPVTAMFILGVLTDIFDGPAARRWPYPTEENNKLWWRRDAHLFDNIADMVIFISGLISLSINSVNWRLAFVGILLGTVIIVNTVSYFHSRNLALAERIDVLHGWCYALLLFAMLIAMTIKATNQWQYVLVAYCVSAIIILWFKWERATTRPETNPAKYQK